MLNKRYRIIIKSHTTDWGSIKKMTDKFVHKLFATPVFQFKVKDHEKLNSELSSIKRCLLLIFIQFLGLSSLLLYFSNKIYFALNTVILLIFCLIMSICFTKKHKSNYIKIENRVESSIN